MSERVHDIAVVGAGPAGLMTALFAARRGLRVSLLEQGDAIGGALLINRGQLSGAGTRLQRERGIADSPAQHLEDILRLSHGTADRARAELSVGLQGPFIDWLMDEGFEMAADMPRIIHGQEAYTTARTYWGRDEGLSLVRLIAPMIDELVRAGRIELRLGTRVESLDADPSGTVGGVLLAGGEHISAREVVLCTGGYGANAKLFARLHPGETLWSGAWRGADGSGLEMAERLGASIVHADTYAPNFGGILDHTVDPPRFRSFGGLTPQDRPPWEIVVNAAGRRFYNEECPSVEQRARALADQPGGRAWVVFDAGIRAAAPNLFSYFTATKAARFHEDSEWVWSAPTLDELAKKAGIDAGGLRETVDAYNAAAAGADDPLGRTHVPRPIHEPPYCAVGIAVYSVRTFGGLRTDDEFRVLGPTGAPIPGLRAVGEVLGNFIVGRGSAGGMALTPALVFGRWLGERVLAGVDSGAGGQPAAAAPSSSARP